MNRCQEKIIISCGAFSAKLLGELLTIKRNTNRRQFFKSMTKHAIRSGGTLRFRGIRNTFFV